MEAAKLGGRDRAIEDVAEELVPVVEPARVAGVVQIRLLDELLERRVEVRQRPVHDPGEHLRDEAAADDCAGPGDLAGIRRELGDPGEDCVLDRVRNLRLADLPAVDAGVRIERAEQLLDVQGEPIRPLVDRLHDLTRRGQAGVEDQGRHQSGLLAGEWGETDFLGQALADQPGPPFAEEGAGWQLLGSVGADDQHGTVADALRQLADDLEAHVVGPLDVLEIDEDGPAERREDPVDHVEDQDAARPECVGGLVDALGQQIVAEAAEARHRPERPREIHDQGGRDVDVLWGDRAVDDLEPLGPGLAADRAEEARLADAGLAGKEQELAVTGRRLG